MPNFLISSLKRCEKFAKYSLFIFFLFEDNQRKLSHVHLRKLMPWPCQQMELSPPSLEPTLPFQSIVLGVPSSQVRSNGPMFHPELWINAKNRLDCCEIIVKHSIETSSRRCIESIVSKRGTHFAHSFLMSKFSVNMQCTAFLEMPTLSDSSRTFRRRSSNTIL